MSNNAEQPLSNKKVLIVDDNRANILSLSIVLKRRVAEIISAENGKIALELLEKYPDIDIVLMDIMMPVMDGYEAIGNIRRSEQSSKKHPKPLPIIAVTAKATSKDREHCLTIGADKYLSKPIKTQELFDQMCDLLLPNNND